MSPAGYSGTPLLRKLGLAAGQRACVLGEPEGYRDELGELPAGLGLAKRLSGERDFIHLFTRSRGHLSKRFPRLVESLHPDGMVWISWPKKSSGVATDLDGNVVRRLGLEAGLVDVKVCAVDEIWSGLKFVVRREDRAAHARRRPSADGSR